MRLQDRPGRELGGIRGPKTWNVMNFHWHTELFRWIFPHSHSLHTSSAGLVVDLVGKP